MNSSSLSSNRRSGIGFEKSFSNQARDSDVKAERRGLIALDGDGVLVDYVTAYGAVWARFVESHVNAVDAQAYFPHHRWGVPWLAGEDLVRFQSFFDHDFWSGLPPIEGALEACHLLVSHGCELVCVTALHHEHRDARSGNLAALGFPISSVYTTPHIKGTSLDVSPKASILHQLEPLAFVDDFLPYMRGVSPNIHKALVMRQPNGNPNTNQVELALVGSTHTDLLDFARWWVAD